MTEVLRSIIEPLQSSATVKAIFGEPVSSQGRTVIPVARIAYGFGGGSGHRDKQAEGGGGGGGVVATPLGVIELTEGQTRFVPLHENRKIAVGGLAGLVTGFLWAAWRRRRPRA